MDWPLAISRNRDALLRIIAVLFALAGLTERGMENVMPRPVHRAILRILRPAESAVRRLIFIAARGLVLKPRCGQSAPTHIIVGNGVARNPAFCLIDPLKRFAPLAGFFDDEVDDGEDVFDLDSDGGEGHAMRTFPRISVLGFVDPVSAAPHDPNLQNVVKTEALSRRLQALKLALDNLPKQARRLVRWQARRVHLRQQFPQRAGRLSPFRPGLPPGFRARQPHEVDAVLRECNGLMRDVMAEPNTS